MGSQEAKKVPKGTGSEQGKQKKYKEAKERKKIKSQTTKLSIKTQRMRSWGIQNIAGIAHCDSPSCVHELGPRIKKVQWTNEDRLSVQLEIERKRMQESGVVEV